MGVIASRSWKSSTALSCLELHFRRRPQAATRTPGRFVEGMIWRAHVLMSEVVPTAGAHGRAGAAACHIVIVNALPRSPRTTVASLRKIALK